MQAFKQTYLCLYARTYQITDEKTGEVTNEGISIKYVPDNDLSPRQDEQAAARGQDVRGVNTAKLTLPLKELPKLGIFPALYEFDLEMAVVADKLQVRAKSIEFVSPVKLVKDEAA